MIEILLPYPLSANRYWQSFVPKGATRAIVHLSNEAKEFKRNVAGLVWAAGIREPIPGRIRVSVRVYPHRPQDWRTRQRKHGACWDDTVQCIDLDNASKVLLDAMKGTVFVDDAWVRELTLQRMEPDAKGSRTVVRIQPIPTEQLQQGLDLPAVQQPEAVLPF